MVQHHRSEVISQIIIGFLFGTVTYLFLTLPLTPEHKGSIINPVERKTQ